MEFESNGWDLETVVGRLKQEEGLSDDSIALLKDKGFRQDAKGQDFEKLHNLLSIPDDTFKERRDRRFWIDINLDRLDALGIEDGRYEQAVEGFHEISSEQAMIRGRLKFAAEYDIALADLLGKDSRWASFIDKPFSESEKAALRSIYQEGYRTKDAAIIKLIEDRTNHDVVAANTWLVVRAEQKGLDAKLMRKITHFARTSADANYNTEEELFTKAIGKWCESLGKLVGVLGSRAKEYAKMTCIAETHGQDAQLTTFGHIYANLAFQLGREAEPLLGAKKFRLEGKIGGATGTDVDFRAALPGVNPVPMYRRIVEKKFGLKYEGNGFDQDGSNKSLVDFLDVMVNAGLVVQKAATDVWMYASRPILQKATKPGEAGSSAMPQKRNPFLAEGAEALSEILASEILPIKRMLLGYREQGDLRRSITKREAFHPIMLSIIAMERLRKEIEKNYQPDVLGMENEIYKSGPQVASSAIQSYLRKEGVEDAYDRIKDVVANRWASPLQIERLIKSMEKSGQLTNNQGDEVLKMLEGVMDGGHVMKRLEACWEKPERRDKVLAEITKTNRDVKRRTSLLGTAVRDTYRMAKHAQYTVKQLERYTS